MKRQYIDFVPRKSVKKSVTVKKDGTETELKRIKSEKIVVPMKRSVVNKTVVKKTEKVSAPVSDKKAAKQVEKKTIEKTVIKPVVKSETKKTENESDKTIKLPAPKFMNAEKVDKRPLSKNVYQKKVVVPEEKPSKPVTIIDKPEKDSKVWLIVTIIITIILGAAAGTVAFLLLPK